MTGNKTNSSELQQQLYQLKRLSRKSLKDGECIKSKVSLWTPARSNRNNYKQGLMRVPQKIVDGIDEGITKVKWVRNSKNEYSITFS